VALAIEVIEVEFELPLHPDGNVQVYDVAPATAAILYVWDTPWQTAVLPAIETGCPGVVRTVTHLYWRRCLFRMNYLL
jgi:hypothetical protein